MTTRNTWQQSPIVAIVANNHLATIADCCDCFQQPLGNNRTHLSSWKPETRMPQIEWTSECARRGNWTLRNQSTIHSGRVLHSQIVIQLGNGNTIGTCIRETEIVIRRLTATPHQCDHYGDDAIRWGLLTLHLYRVSLRGAHYAT